MTQHSQLPNFRFPVSGFRVFALLAALAIPHAAMAQTWSGNSSNAWGTAGNWSALPVSNGGLIFTSATGAGGLNLNNNLTTGTGWTVAGMTFNTGAAAFVIGDGTTNADPNAGKGNAFTLTLGITNNSANTQTINSPFSMTTQVSMTTSSGGGNLVLAGPISGTGGTLLIPAGSGSVTLSGNNSFTGGINVGSNTGFATEKLNVNSAGALGSGTFNLTNGALFDNTSGSALTLSTNNAVTFGTAFTFAGSQNLTFGTGAITSNGFTINLNGSGRTLAFGGTLSNTNTTAVVAGAGNTLVLGGLGLMTNTSNGTFSFNGDGNVIITGGVTNGAGQTNNGLQWLNRGTLELRGANTFTNVTSGAGLAIGGGGTVKIASTSTFSTANLVTFASGGGNLIYDNTGATGASNLTLGAISLGFGSTPGSSTIQTNHIANQNITLTLGAISRGGQGTSINFVTNNGTNDGTSNSIYLTNAAGPVGGTVGVYYYNGADYAWMSGVNGYVRAPIYGTDSNTQTTLTGATATTWVKLSSSVTPSANVTVKALTLSGAVDYTQSSGNLTTGALLKSGGGNSTISGATGIAWGASQGAIRVDTTSDKLTISTPITSTAGLTKTGLGTLVLTGANAISGGTRGTSINEGALYAIDGAGLSTGSLLTLLGGVFESNGNFIRTLGTAGGNVNWLTASGGFSAQGGTLNVRLNNGNSTMTWGSTGSFIANYRELVFGSVTADSMVDFQNGLSISTNSNVVRVLDNTASAGDKARISEAITGVGSLIKEGAGTLELTGTNTYTGTTNVNAGRLSINGNQSAAMGAVTVASGATLGGSGTVGGATTIQSGGILATGNSIGTQTFLSGLTIAGTDTVELGTPNASAASGLSDRAAVTGGLALTGSTLALVDNAGANSQGSAGAGAYRIATYTTTLTGTYASVTNPMSATLHEKVIYGAASGGGNVDLNLYRLAAANTVGTPVALTNVRVGGTFGTSALSIQNTAASDGFSEGLNATKGATTGSATASGTDITNLAAGSSSSAILVGLGGNATTGTSGNKTGTVSIGLASNGSGTSGYGINALSAQVVTVSGVVYDYAVPVYTKAGGNGTFGGSGHSYTLDFGTGLALNTDYIATIDLTNGSVVNLFQDSLTGTYNSISSGFSTTASNFSGLTSGTLNSFTIKFNTSSTGTFNQTLTLAGTSVNSGGLSDASLGNYDIALAANVVPEPSTWALLAFSLTTVMVLRRRRNS